MLIRMFVDNIILSVLLLAGVSLCSAEEDGYDYSRPSVGFSDGSSSFGSQSIYTKPTEYVVASSTPQPAAVYNVKPQASISQGFGQQYQSGQQYKSPIVTKPQTLSGGSSSFGQSSASYGQPISSLSQFGQYQNTQTYQSPLVSTYTKPQSNFGAYQGFGQSSAKTGSGQYVSGQYKAPVVSVTSKPQTNFGAYQGFGQSSSKTGTGQYVSGQYKAPVVSVTSKPQTNFGTYQGFGQSSAASGTGQYVSGQYKAPIVSVTSKPQTNFGAFQGFGQSSVATGTGQIVSGQYKAPVVSVTSKPQDNFGAYQGFGQSSAKTGSGQYVSGQYKAPVVSVTSKPQTNFGAYQGFGQSSSTTGTGQYVSGQYKAPVISVTSKPQTNFGTYQGFGQSSAASGTGQYVSGQYKAPVVSVTSKPQTNFGTYQGFGQSSAASGTGQYVSGQYKAPTVSVTSKPQTNFGAYQGFGQSINKLSVSTAPVQYKPSVSVVAKAKPTFTGFQVQSIKPTVVKPIVLKPVVIEQQTTPKPAVSQYFTVKPAQISTVSSFQGQIIKPTVITAQYVKPVIVTPKPQSSFQGFGQKINQQPFKPFNFGSSQTNQYQQSVAKPLSGFGQTSSAFSQYQKPFTSFGNTGPSYLPPSKPAVSQYNFQGASSTVAPAIVTPIPTLTTPRPVVIPSVRPQTSTFNAFQGSLVQPAFNTQSSFNAFQSFGQSTPKPSVGQYQKPVVFTTTKPAFQQPIVQYQKPVVSTPIKSQSTFGSFQGFGQTSYQKPSVSQSYSRPSTTAKPTLSYVPPKAQVEPERYTSTPTTLKPVIVTPKPQPAFSSFGQSVYSKPAVTTFNTFGQQSQYAVKPLVITPKPQTTFGGFGQSVYQKPAASGYNAFGQQSASRYTSTPTTVKPLIVTLKPQPAFSGFGQSTYQKPAVSTFNTFGQQSVGQYTAKPFTVTAKPQTAFGGFGQAVYQKPAVSQTYTASSTTVKPDRSYLPPKVEVVPERYTSTPTTLKPIIVTSKPQPASSGFGQSIYQKPAVSTYNTFGQQSATQYKQPQTAFSGFGQSVYQKPAVSTFNTFSQQPSVVTQYKQPQTGFSGFGQSVYQSPVSVSTTARPQVYTVSTTLAPRPTIAPESLTYLPPKGINVPLNAASASGAISESFFEYPSATANQVVDVALEQKVGGFVADQKSELSTITNQISSDSAQEQKVEGIDLRSSNLTATNKGQEHQELSIRDNGELTTTSRRTTRDTYSNRGYEMEYTPPTGYLSYQGNPISTQQFGGVQPNSYQGVPYQQIAQAQSTLGISNTAASGEQNFQAQQRSLSNGYPSQDPYNFEGQYGGYISSVEDQQQQIPQNFEIINQQQQQQQIPQNYEAAASYTDTVKTQTANESPVQEPQPLNREEQQIRQVEEKPENNFQNLQPGSYIGPHVNKNSDQEYNVFDYDQYSKDPEDVDV